MNIHLPFVIGGIVVFAILFNLALAGGGTVAQSLGEAIVYTLVLVSIPWIIAYNIYSKRGKKKTI